MIPDGTTEKRGRTIFFLTLAFSLLLSHFNCASAETSESRIELETPRPGTHKYYLERVYGFRRSYLLHIPEGYNHSKALPLVVALHGGFGTARQMEERSGLSELADRQGCIVLYPNGITLFGWLQHWNAGHCCGQAMKDGIDDVAFVSRVIDETCRRSNVDRSRISMVGYSNGGMLAYLFAAQKPEILAAVAAIAATVGSRPSDHGAEKHIPPAKAPMPIISFHGRDDDIVPYGRGRPARGRGHLYVPVNESMAFWKTANQAAPLPQREEMLAGRIVKETWRGKNKSAEIVLYTIQGWKHDLPTRYYTRNLPKTDPLMGFHATDYIWDFFKRHRR
jgi:polyhydroxybutyrate depolymerase